jgi:hypothetical protein
VLRWQISLYVNFFVIDSRWMDSRDVWKFFCDWFPWLISGKAYLWEVNGFPFVVNFVVWQFFRDWYPVTDFRSDFVVWFGKYITDGWMASGRRLVRLDGQDVFNLWHQTYLTTYQLKYNSKDLEIT